NPIVGEALPSAVALDHQLILVELLAQPCHKVSRHRVLPSRRGGWSPAVARPSRPPRAAAQCGTPGSSPTLAARTRRSGSCRTSSRCTPCRAWAQSSLGAPISSRSTGLGGGRLPGPRGGQRIEIRCFICSPKIGRAHV